MTKTYTYDLQLEKYNIAFSVDYAQGMEPEITSMEFFPPLEPEDLSFTRDVEVYDNDTYGSLVLRYLHWAKIEGEHIEELITQMI